MRKTRILFLIYVIIIFSFLLFKPIVVFADQSTPVLPTVTGTPSGPIVTVRSDQEQYINVRSGPGIFYPKVGVLLVGQQAVALGRSVGGDWIMIEYHGIPGGVAWVYTPFVSITPGTLPVVEPPPTPTPLLTATIDPTLAAQFIVTTEPTRLPTYTPPSPLVTPDFLTNGQSTSIQAGIPMGLIIIVLFSVGGLLGLVSLTQGR